MQALLVMIMFLRNIFMLGKPPFKFVVVDDYFCMVFEAT